MTALRAAPARADSCQVLKYTFQPDCYRTANSVMCSQTYEHLDLGPQIAVWITSADGAQFIDTVMVTNMVAARGIGNRPGLWNVLSGPKFPYGKRQMALPIWAHARGKLYPTVVMPTEENEGWIGFNEAYSSPEDYFCRPLNQSDISGSIMAANPAGMIFCPSNWSSCLSRVSSAVDFAVDAVTCPTKFNSSKGKLDTSLPQQYYPPRNDLTTFTGNDPAVAQTFATMNDLDAVAAATPPYGQPYSGLWYVPSDLAPGDYAVWVEVNKEFDTNASHDHPSVGDTHGGLDSYGVHHNFGQPSVVYRVPIHIDALSSSSAATTAIQGYSEYSDSTGASGAMLPRDATITADPGSGEARLLEIAGPTGMGRVHVSLEQMGGTGSQPSAVSDLRVAATDITATTAIPRFSQANVNGMPVMGYEIRYRAAEGTTLTLDEFTQSPRADQVTPGTPGGAASVLLSNLKPATHYVVGVRAQGPCAVVSDVVFVDFTTTAQKFTQLGGCFIATAAYGSTMDREVAALRAARDQLLPRSALFAVATDLYYRSGPAAAALIGRSETARAVARRLIAPVAKVAEIAEVARGVAGVAGVARDATGTTTLR